MPSDGVGMRIVDSLDALAALAGQDVAVSDWLRIEQDRVQCFADATGDQQWIHTDPERASRESPFGGTVAHGYLTLSLLPAMFESTIRIDGIRMAVNYGLDRVRFPAPVRVGARIRAHLVLDRVEPVAGGIQATWTATVEIDGGDKPACVAQMLVRYYPT